MAVGDIKSSEKHNEEPKNENEVRDDAKELTIEQLKK
jgi:hypothetical protein